MKKEPQQTQKKKFRFTLRIKWSLDVGLTIFLTFMIFASILYASFYNNLVIQEKQSTDETAKLIADRLSDVKGGLKGRAVLPLLVPEYYGATSQDAAAKFSQDSIVNQLSRTDFNIVIYNQNAKQIFASQKPKVAFKPVEERREELVRVDGRSTIVVTLPIYQQSSYDLIGYVFLTNRMDNVRRSAEELRLQMFVLVVIAVLFSGFVGYTIVYRLSKRIKMISETIQKVDRSPESSARIPEMPGNDEINDLADQFNSMLDQVQRYIEQQKEFVGDVSHELRTPVAVIQGHLQLLNRWGKDDPEVLAESLAAASQEASRMNSLIEEMLQLTRAEQVEQKNVQEVTDVREVIMQIVDNIQMLHQDFSIMADVDLDNEVSVRMNRNHLEQILVILLDNAIKYSATRKEIHLSADRDQQHIKILVQDFGLGISPTDQQRIFDRFYRVDKARSRERGGNGLGLSIAFRLVKAYGGELTVDSVEGSGSIFKVSLPILPTFENSDAEEENTPTS